MRQYLDYLRNVHENGAVKGDRTGTGTASLFGQTMRFDLQRGFPIVTTKFVPFRLVVAELIWFLSGSTNNEDLRRLNGNNKPTIWEEWALPESGDLGPIYGKQWRHYGGRPSSDGIPGHWEGGVDQIQMTIDMLRKRPNSRRLVISPWNPAELPDESMNPQENVRAGRMALAPCHALFQFYVSEGKLSCQMVQRSADSLLGVPFNISSYALLTHMFAQQCDLDVGEFIWVGGDCHVYSNHKEQVETQLAREPLALPKLVIKRRPETIFDYRVEDFELVGYEHHPPISAPVAV